MASSIQLTGSSSQYLSLTTAIDYNSDYTACWWQTNPTGLSNYSTCAGFDVGTGTSTEFDRLLLQKGNKDTQWRFAIVSRDSGSDSITTTYSGFVVGGGPWFVTVKRTGNDMFARVYHGSTYTEITLTSGVSSRGSATGTTLGYMPSNTATATPTAELAHFKAWSRALTDAELDREKKFSRAQSRDSIVGEWPMRGGSTLRDLDYSGKGNDLVETNSPTDGTTSFGVAVQPQPILIEPAAETGVDVTPGTASLVTALFAPTVVATADIDVTPATVALVTALFAPTVVATANINVTPATAALATALFAPAVVATADIDVTPATAALATALFAPTVSVTTGAVTVTPATASLATTLYAPTVSVTTGAVTVTPSTFVLRIQRTAPVVATGKWVYPASVALPTTGYAPTASVTTNIVMVRPVSGSLVTTGYAPTVVTNTPQAIITSGTWSSEVTFARGDEYIVTLEGPAANAPAFRVGLTFRSTSS